MKFINDQYEKYLQEEVSVNRKKRIPDTRVHCCLYFIPATGHSYVPRTALCIHGGSPHFQHWWGARRIPSAQLLGMGGGACRGKAGSGTSQGCQQLLRGCLCPWRASVTRGLGRPRIS